MANELQKLRPDRDLQCYFERPSAIAALSETSASGFTVSGCWRQQFDWAVVEWNRDNVFEHPSLRNLPDGDLSGIRLSYEEVRTNCIPLDSALYPTLDWPYLRIWAEDGGTSTFHQISLKQYATAVEGGYLSGTATFHLQGTPSAGDYIELAWLTEHYNYQLSGSDTLASAATALALIITQFSGTVSASATGAAITLTYRSAAGANANRIGVYGTVKGTGTGNWEPAAALFTGGTSPTKWRVDLAFAALTDINGVTVPTTNVRKMRWTWAADLQQGNFSRSEFSVVIANWAVTGASLSYQVAGPGSFRIEDDSNLLTYGGTWVSSCGNFSGGSIRYSTRQGSTVSATYRAAGSHRLYLGTRRAATTGAITVELDGGSAVSYDLSLAGEDVLTRLLLGTLAGGTDHTVTITYSGADGSYCYFDFLEIAVAATALASYTVVKDTTLASDWDTDHSIALAPERTAWLIYKLGFGARVNHYAGALWFYELIRAGHQYASITVQFSGCPVWSTTTQIALGATTIEHVNLIGDTATSVAKSFELLINAGTTGVWAQASGSGLTITSRTMGAAGNGLGVSVATNSTEFTAQTSGTQLAGGVDGTWTTDLSATPRLNRAARDWSRSYFKALLGYGIAATASFSMELQHGDSTVATGIAQRYPSGDAVWLSTPALQTNFSPSSLAFWKQVYADMAQVMTEAGMAAYLQFGEVQWWYFPAASGMPFYDAYTRESFQAQYGAAMQTITSPSAEPAAYINELEHLRKLIGEFTAAVMAFVRVTAPAARFEVLYAPDVNDTALMRAANLPVAYWTPTALDCFKTENFTFTGDRDLDKARTSILLPIELGFARERCSHLVGISDYTTPWAKEHRLSQAEGIESVVLFALDQFCLIGYTVPLKSAVRSARRQGSR
jgi:hypothetical protein